MKGTNIKFTNVTNLNELERQAIHTSNMIRVGRIPSSSTENLPAGGVAYILFTNLTSTTTRGTFSYKYEVD